MDFTHLEAVMAFFGLASIVIGLLLTALRSMCFESHRLYRPNARAANHDDDDKVAVAVEPDVRRSR